MHPVIRIACFILLVMGLAMSKWLLYFSSLPLLILFWHYANWQSLLQLLKRLRWLLVSLFILHLWFHGADVNLIPSQTSLLIAIEKTFVLILMITTAHLLLVVTPIDDLIAAIQWWFKPFNLLGFNPQKLAIRLALTLETLNHVHELYQQQTKCDAPNPIAQISLRATDLFQAVAQRAEQAPLSQLEIAQLPAPALWQWMYPVSLIMLMVMS